MPKVTTFRVTATPDLLLAAGFCVTALKKMIMKSRKLR